MKIERIEDNLIVTIPLKAQRSNPYMDETDLLGDYSCVAGVIETHEGYTEIGFMNLIDMDYKGKDDQLGSWIIHYDGGKEEFEKLCKNLSLDIWYI